MNNYRQASKIVFVDLFLKEEIDLSNMPSFTYSFENQVQGAQNGRFLLRVYSIASSLNQVYDNKTIHIYPSESGVVINTSSFDPIQQIHVFDLQGRKLYEKALSNTSSYLIAERFNASNVIVNVVTKRTVRTASIILK